MKILMLGHKRIPSREGGVERVVEELGVRMADAGHDVCVFNRYGRHVSGKEFELRKSRVKEYKGIRIKTIPTFKIKSLNAVVYAFFGTVLATFKHSDVIHFHTEGICAFLFLPWLFRKNIVVTVHGLDWKRGKWKGFSKKFIKFGEKCAAKYADEIIVLSEDTRRYFKETYNRQTVYIPNGANTVIKRKAELITEQFGLKKDKYILFLARLVPEKGLHYLLEAFKQIDTDMKLVIAGGGSHSDDYVEEITNMAAEDDRVIMTGFVQGELLDELYSNAYLYVLPSDIEGMPMSLIEAYTYGNCALVSDIYENASVAADRSITFEHSNVEDLRLKLSGLIEDKTVVEAFKADISDYILKKYNWDDIVEETLALYRRKQQNII